MRALRQQTGVVTDWSPQLQQLGNQLSKYSGNLIIWALQHSLYCWLYALVTGAHQNSRSQLVSEIQYSSSSAVL